MITTLSTIDLIGIVVVILRLLILGALAMFLYSYTQVKKHDLKVMMIQTVVISFLVALFLMIGQSLTFRVLTLLDASPTMMQSAVFVLVVTLAVFIILVYARRVYRQLVLLIELENDQDTPPTLDRR